MRCVIAGIHSGVGKTTLTSGLIAALSRRGLIVQPYKVGPDYIDPTYLTLAAGRPCRNLDSWMLPPQAIGSLFASHSRQVDISVIEGVMGLYDGFDYLEDSGSTAQIAKMLQTPVILILDAAKSARSVAATALGFKQFDLQTPLAAFIINHASSAGHGEGVARAVQESTGLPVLGWLPSLPALEIPERHLGLIPTAERGCWLEFINSAADGISQYLDLDALLSLAASAPALPEDVIIETPARHNGPAPLIAVARDEAFNFIYEDNLDLLKAAGAEIACFSPLNDHALPAGTAGIILSGGFPEMFAGQLAANQEMPQAIRSAAAQNIPIYAECGGLMVLTQSITDLQGKKYPMWGLLPGESLMTRQLTLGYRQVKTAADSWLMPAAEILRGHEFHYSIWSGRPAGLAPVFEVLPSDQKESYPEGAISAFIWASYIHLHFLNHPQIASRFVAACQQRKAEHAG